MSENTGNHCCICTGVCAHTGGVQYCEMHNPNRREVNNFDAPYATCFHCAKKDQRIDELEDVVLSGINLISGLAGIKLEGVAELSYRLFVESIKEAYHIED